MTALAGGLVDRRHRVTFVGIEDAADLLRDPRIGFAAIAQRTFPRGSGRDIAERMVRTSGLLGIGGVLRAAARMTDHLCEEGPALLRRIGAEAVIADQVEPAGGLLARHLGLPHVSVANALLIEREDAVPPFSLGWRYRDDAWGRQRNRGGYRVMDWAMKPLIEIVARYDRLWRLGGLATVDDCLSPLLRVSQTVPGFDYPRRAAPPSLVQVGPLRRGDPGRWSTSDVRPLVFCSLGSLKGDRLDVFQAAAEACRSLDLHLVIAHGDRLGTREIASLRGGPEVHAFVPQRAVLARSSALVTHGGLNTVLDALTAGVPLVVIPLAFEQAAIAARVEYCGAGLVIPPRQLTSERLRAALRRLLSEPGFKQRAAALAHEIAGAGGVARAAGLIEAAVRPEVQSVSS